MSYYRRRYWSPRYSRGSYTPRTTAAEKLNFKFKGVNKDILTHFYSLNQFQLNLVFAKYEILFGKEKRKYAESSYPNWKRGSKGISTETVERLIKLVPQVLTTAERYTLIKKLWTGFRVRETIRITLHPDSCNSGLVKTLTGRILQGSIVRIPESLQGTLAWLYDEDSMAIQGALDTLEREDSIIISNSLLLHIDEIKAAAQKAVGLNFNSVVTVTLPFANVIIEITNTHKTKTMNENNREESPDKNDQLVPKNDQNQITIHNPSDLLGEALQRLPKKKAEELLGKASEDALRLQVKQTETRMDRESFKASMDNAVVGAQRASEDRNIQFEAKHEHTSAHGRSTVHVKTVPQALPQSESKIGMKCFIATACYGDELHPDLDTLRQFRDSTLVRYRVGRRFVDWYYANGESLAIKLRPHVLLKRIVRAALALFARSVRFVS